MSASTEIIPYAGWPRNLRIANADVELVVTLDVGPRVIRYAAPGGRNLFGETADQLGKSGEPHWMPRGGHRLWTAPEDKTRTYAPDNRPGRAPGARRPTTRRRAGAADPARPTSPTASRRSSTSRSGASGSRAAIVHRITNVGDGRCSCRPGRSR